MVDLVIYWDNEGRGCCGGGLGAVVEIKCLMYCDVEHREECLM